MSNEEEKIELNDSLKTVIRYNDSKLNSIAQEHQIITFQKQLILNSAVKDAGKTEGVWKLDEDYNLVLVEQEPVEAPVEPVEAACKEAQA